MKQKIASLSILANIILAVTKITAGFISGSAAILAAGIDSLIDILSSIISYAGIKISKKPADKKHPYGHHKFEVLSGVAITVIVLITGIGIIYKAYQGFLNPEEVKISYLIFGVMIFSIVVNEVMARLKIYYGKKENSVSLLSDGIHSRVDVYTSLAILVGLFFSPHWIYTDAFLALLMGIYIIKEAFSVGKEAVSSLLDVSASEEIEEKIKSITKSQKIETSVLKTQKRGSAITANLEIKLPSSLNVNEAAQISNTLKEKLIKAIDSLEYVSIQITSHEIETSFYKPEFGKSFGWQRQGKFSAKGGPASGWKNTIKVSEAQGHGPAGHCICSECGYKIKHQRGAPCSSLKCPKCKINLNRE